jgi:signal transduction histidine kinase
MGFRLKLIASYAAIVVMMLVLSLALFLFLAQQIQQNQRDEAEKRLASQTSQVQRAIQNPCPSPFQNCKVSLDYYRSQLVVFANVLAVRILMVDENGLVLVDTISNTTNNLENKTLPDYTLVTDDNKPYPGSRKINDVAYIYYALLGPDVQLSDTGRPGRTALPVGSPVRTNLILGVPEQSLDANRNNLVSGMILGGLLVFALSVVVAILIARSVARPLIRMTRASEAIAQGDYTQELLISKNSESDEIGRLALSFNRMVREVARSQQTMRDFVANVSHELKTPLTSIQGFSQAIIDGTADDRALLDHSAAVINHEAARMRRLVDELLDLSRIESGQIELARRDIDLQKLLERVVSKLAPQAAEKQLIIDTRLNAFRSQLDLGPYAPLTSGPVIMGDGDRLEQIFTNLLDNAIKYSPKGGEVEVALRLGGQETNRAPAQGRYYWSLVEISNRGPVIPSDQLSRIFERFYKLDKSRARRRGESTGLGLAIAKELIEAHRGTITVTSEPLDTPALYPVALASNPAQTEGRTTFTVSLPLLALPTVSTYQPIAQG